MSLLTMLGLLHAQDTAFDRRDHGLGAIVHAELLMDAQHVGLHGPLANEQSARDFLVALALGDERKHLDFAQRKSAARHGPLGELRGRAFGDVSSAGMNLADSG